MTLPAITTKPMSATVEVPSLTEINVGLADFRSHCTDTWIPGYEDVMGFFEEPTVRLEEEYGEENVDPALFDFGLFNDAVARAVLDISCDRIESALSHSFKGDLNLRKKLSYQGLGGKHRDGIYARVRVDFDLAAAIQCYLFGNGEAGARLSDLHEGTPPRHYSDFAHWIEERYASRPGFLPYESTNAAEWARETSGFTDFRPDRRGHKLGTIFEFVMKHHEAEYGDEWDGADLYYAVMEDGDLCLAEYYKGSLPEGV